ncbi:Transcriptional activator of fatty acid utilization [Paramecium bursaria]
MQMKNQNHEYNFLINIIFKSKKNIQKKAIILKNRRKNIMNQINQYLDQEQYGLLVKLFMKRYPKRIKTYQKLKLSNLIYFINQNVAIAALNNDLYSGKIIKILCLFDLDEKIIPMVQIQWYYQKQDLELEPELTKGISEKELFFSMHQEYLPANKLHLPIFVLDFEEYQKLDYEEETYFFTRAQIDLKTMLPQPPIQEWKKICICRLPQNPDLSIIQCEACNEWYHLECLMLTNEEVDKIEKYVCPNCID